MQHMVCKLSRTVINRVRLVLPGANQDLLLRSMLSVDSDHHQWRGPPPCNAMVSRDVSVLQTSDGGLQQGAVQMSKKPLLPKHPSAA
jgi:hypothetical protein